MCGHFYDIAGDPQFERRGYFGKASISEMNMKIRIQPWAYKGCKGTQMCISCVLYYTYIQKQSKTCIIIYKYTCHIYMIYWICLYIHSECCDRTIRRDLSNSAIHKKRVEIITFTQNVMQLQRRAEAARKSSKRMPQKCPQIDIGPHVGPGEFMFFSMVLWMFAVGQLWKINDFERKNWNRACYWNVVAIVCCRILCLGLFGRSYLWNNPSWTSTVPGFVPQSQLGPRGNVGAPGSPMEAGRKAPVTETWPCGNGCAGVRECWKLQACCNPPAAWQILQVKWNDRALKSWRFNWNPLIM